MMPFNSLEVHKITKDVRWRYQVICKKWKRTRNNDTNKKKKTQPGYTNGI